MFDIDSNGYRNKRVENYINVSVCVDLVWGNTSISDLNPYDVMDIIYRMSKCFDGEYNDVDLIRKLGIPRSNFYLYKKRIKESNGRY